MLVFFEIMVRISYAKVEIFTSYKGRNDFFSTMTFIFIYSNAKARTAFLPPELFIHILLTNHITISSLRCDIIYKTAETFIPYISKVKIDKSRIDQRPSYRRDVFISN